MANGAADLREADASSGKSSSSNGISKSGNPGLGNLPVRIVVADERRLYRECVKLLIETIDPDLDVVETDNADQISTLLEQNPGRGLVLYNLVQYDQTDIDFVGALGKSLGEAPLIVMCGSDDSNVMRRVLENGAKAFLPSSSPGPLLVAVIHLVFAGGVYVPPAMVVGGASDADGAVGRNGTDERRHQVIAENFQMLTPRQRHVLVLLSQGLSNRNIADSLEMCENTVKAHVKQIMRKLEAHNRTQAALMADRLVA